MKKKISVSALVVLLIVLSMTAGAYAATKMTLLVNGKTSNVEPVVIKGVTYIPVRAAAEMLGADVYYDSASKIVSITSKGGSTPVSSPQSASTSVSYKNKISEPTTFDYSINSANGIKLTWFASNLTSKTINYYTLKISTYNRVGDPSFDEINGNSEFTVKYVGPVEPGGNLVSFNLFTYQSALHAIVIDEIILEYSDGSKETIEYGFKTTDDRGMK